MMVVDGRDVWRVRPNDPGNYVEMQKPDGTWQFPDCGIECSYCLHCMGCLRKLYFEPSLADMFHCQLSPDGRHLWSDREDEEGDD